MLRTLFLLPFLLVLVAFALSNQEPVRLALWPTDLSVEAPLSIAVLIASGVFFFLGALFVWWGSIAASARAKRSERRARALEAELAARDKAAAATPRGAAPMSLSAPALAPPSGVGVLAAPR